MKLVVQLDTDAMDMNDKIERKTLSALRLGSC